MAIEIGGEGLRVEHQHIAGLNRDDRGAARFRAEQAGVRQTPPRDQDRQTGLDMPPVFQFDRPDTRTDPSPRDISRDPPILGDYRVALVEMLQPGNAGIDEDRSRSTA